jgi:hypothetical protein
MDFDSLIPGNLWGSPDVSTGEVDFMHFQGDAHNLLANSIENWVGMKCWNACNHKRTKKINF